LTLIIHQTARGAILTFLLFQASLSCTSIHEKFGVQCLFTEYVKTLPCEMLPTFWSAEELRLLAGTTLAPAVSSKMNRLRKEYDQLCSMIANTKWFRLVQMHLDFDDWMQVDAMFRSRALEFHGSCMIPGMPHVNCSQSALNSHRNGSCQPCSRRSDQRHIR
jgi:hypothetical protein